MEWPSSYLDEYEKLVMRLSPPRATVDNAACDNATRVMIDSSRKHGTLLEAIQILTDMDLTIKKAYISSDGQWLMAVFHVTDLGGNKITDKRGINYIEQSLSKIQYAGFKSIEGLTALELTGTDRVGLLAEVFAVLSDLQVNVVESKVWTHNGRIASLIYVKDCDSGFPIQDGFKIDMIETQLRNVLRGDNDIGSVKTLVSLKVTHTERRLHQMMFADRDYEHKPIIRTNWDFPIVLIQNCLERGYSGINVYCEDRARLLFDVACTLTDMSYVVFHATLKTTGDRAHMEFFVRHTNGLPISSEAEKQFVSLCLRAAIERRASEGVWLELRAEDRPGSLAEIMRTFGEYGLNVARAEISTPCKIARNSFYVTDAVGNAADTKMIESVRQKIGLGKLRVKELPLINYYKKERNDDPPSTSISGAFLISLGNLVTRNSRGSFLISLGNLVTRNLRYLGSLIRSYSGTIKSKIVLV
ncbi:ACT domain-containing protein ACR8-like [Heracleum sosnowskyi]|uniref:ACT domain-containing protein ACR n=1 Tax=Heracleum sosnowskyi TaxID=360622 RepID=A0AAD8MJ30_9APIA|nr:ACT domain-containing protein ACR8-like [Heracleum sosnowskyi]